MPPATHVPTPGPWRATAGGFVYFDGARERDGGAMQVAICRGRTPAEVVANAHLTAAAHDLLAELKNMTLLFRVALLCTTVEIAREARPHLDAADAAIARAEGRRT